ncbi:MAG: DUF982 domain-containing protein [Mesorhizobium sp.]|nr:MAG: DUF982 domain-containing protein [Mesorhizobium sp.]
MPRSMHWHSRWLRNPSNQKGPKWKKAVQLCTEALAGRASPEEAHMALRGC